IGAFLSTRGTFAWAVSDPLSSGLSPRCDRDVAADPLGRRSVRLLCVRYPRPVSALPMPRPSGPRAAAASRVRMPASRQDWRVLLAVFWITSMVEGLGVSQVFAFVPSYLRLMGVGEAERLQFVGLFGALIFVVGMPLVPLWGVWADKYSRKAVIVRSAIVEAVVFAAIARSREPWQLAASLLLIGLQLGNTGVMLAGIRDVTPRASLGTTIALFGASGAVPGLRAGSASSPGRRHASASSSPRWVARSATGSAFVPFSSLR